MSRAQELAVYPPIRTLFRWALPALLTLLLGACEFFGPPFNFSNPYDPQQELTALDSVGHPLFETTGGLVRVEPFAVWSDGTQEIIVAPGHEGTVRTYRTDGSYETFSTGGADGHAVHDVCFGPSNDAPVVYAAADRGIHRIDVQSGTIERYWLEMEGVEFRTLTADPYGGFWAFAIERSYDDGSYGGEQQLLMRIGSSGSVSRYDWIDEWSIDRSHVDLAVSRALVAVSRDHDILFFEREDGWFRGRLVYDSSLPGYTVLFDSSDDTYGSLNVDEIAFNAASGQFVAAGYWDDGSTNYVAYLDGSDGSFVSGVGGAELPDFEWSAVASTGEADYVANRFTRDIVRVDDWVTVHANSNPDPLGFLRVDNLTIDPYTDPPVLYALDSKFGAVHVLDAQTLEFDRFFGTRGFASSEIRSPQALVATEDGLLLAKFSDVYAFGRDGSSFGLQASFSYHVRDFTLHDETLISIYDWGDGVGILSHPLDGSAGYRDDYFSRQGGAVGLITNPADDTQRVIGATYNADTEEVVIGYVDPVTGGLSRSGSFSRDAFRRPSADHVEVNLTDMAVSPQGFIWILNGPGPVIKTDVNGEIFRTIWLPDGAWYRSIAVSEDGRVFIAGDHSIAVYGPQPQEDG